MNGSVTYEGLILQGGINVDTGAELEELTVYENGVYKPSEGKDGFSKVTVDVPEAVLDDISISENGHYTPPIGVDGYNDIVVSVPHPAPVLDDITITENGSYQPPTGVDGYNNITVNVPAPAPVIDDITITANGHYTPPTGTDGYDDITVNVPLPANGIYKQTLSGLPAPIATFTGANAPLNSLKASIVGVQDLHGYDKPWPAGGGKNKAITKSSGFTINGVTFTINADGSIKLNGTADTTGNIRVTNPATVNAGTTYTVSIGVSASIIGYGVSGFGIGTYTITPTNNYSDASVQVRTVSGTTYNTTIYPQLEIGSQASSFESYSNICPISGWTSCEVTDNNDTYTIQFKDSSNNPITVYGGGIDVTGGKLTVTHANIASYNGEAINDPWISSEDAYASGTTPTTGAQVVYPLTTPLVYEFNPLALRSDGVTNISVDCGEVTELKYFSETP